MIAPVIETTTETKLKERFAAIIFDMDGVIVDSEPRHIRAFMDVFRELGYEHNHGINFESYLGQSDEAVWIDFCDMHQPEKPRHELQDWKQSHVINILKEEEPIFLGLPSLVEKLAARVPLAVASGSLHPVIDAVLEIGNLREKFQHVVSIQDVSHPKPAPDVFLRAAELLAIDPADICVIEDSAAGVQAALSAGMQVIAITNSLPAAQLA
ncbi:MAG: HAD family hydrolase, partial [Limisphaerales bacterium]